MAAYKFDKKIVGVAVAADKEATEVVVATEKIDRPEALRGRTYKIKPGTSKHSYYITINNIELNGEVRPFEMFVQSKNVDHLVWVNALSRVISAVFRKGGDYEFLVEELGALFDPNGGYFKDGKYMPSVVAEIGEVLGEHIQSLRTTVTAEVEVKPKRDSIEGATLCKECRTMSVVLLDGCPTCLSCGNSKCG